MAGSEIQLARIDEKVSNLSKGFDAHIVEDTERFNRVFSYMKERFDKIENKLDSLVTNKVEPLWDNKNKQEGAFSFGRLVAGGFGGAIVAIIDVFAKGGH